MPDILSTADTTVRSGAYNRVIKIQKVDPNATLDAMGGKTRSFVDYISTFAHIGPWKGKEQFIGQQVYPTMYTKFLIRYRPSLTIDATMQIVYKSRIFNIRSVRLPEEAQTTIEILAEEQQAKGSP